MGALVPLKTFGNIFRLPLADVPTPLIELKRLSSLLQGPRIFMKREDLTGFGMGGNKVRKFEFFMADALERGADCCVAIGAIQSNHLRVTAASALHFGLKSYLVLMGEKPAQLKGNLLLNHMLGAEIIYVPAIFDFEGRMRRMLALAEDLRREGKNPYVLPVVGALGCIGPMMAMEEALRQTRSMGIRISGQFIAAGTGESLVGLAIGVERNGAELETVGVCIGREQRRLSPVVERLKTEAKVLISENPQSRANYHITDDYLGEAGHPTKEGLEAIRLIAKTEGIFLDPIYTGKAMAAMVDMIRKRRFGRNDNLLFWNTSSAPIFFAYDHCYLDLLGCSSVA